MNKILLILFLLISFSINCSQAFAQEVKKRVYLPISKNGTLLLQNNTVNLLVKDYLDSSRVEVRNAEIMILSYSPFGNTLDPRFRGDDDQLLDHQFTGHRKLENSSLYKAGARFYSPIFGTFIQPDQKDGPNRYAYVGNDPILYKDTTGTNRESAVTEKVVRWIAESLGHMFSKESPIALAEVPHHQAQGVIPFTLPEKDLLEYDAILAAHERRMGDIIKASDKDFASIIFRSRMAEMGVTLERSHNDLMLIPSPDSRLTKFWVADSWSSDTPPRIIDIEVKPKLRNAGAGRRVVEVWESYISDLGISSQVGATNVNPESEIFWEKMGYQRDPKNPRSNNWWEKQLPQ